MELKRELEKRIIAAIIIKGNISPINTPFDVESELFLSIIFFCLVLKNFLGCHSRLSRF